MTIKKYFALPLIPPLAILLICGSIVMRWEILGRGSGMWAGYPFGFIIQLFFGFIALWAAGYVGDKPSSASDTIWLNLLKLASIFACFDLVWSLTEGMVLGRFALAGLAHLGLAMWMFRQWGIRAIWVVVFTFPVKAIAVLMLDTTLYTFF